MMSMRAKSKSVEARSTMTSSSRSPRGMGVYLIKGAPTLRLQLGGDYGSLKQKISIVYSLKVKTGRACGEMCVI